MTPMTMTRRLSEIIAAVNAGRPLTRQDAGTLMQIRHAIENNDLVPAASGFCRCTSAHITPGCPGGALHDPAPLT